MLHTAESNFSRAGNLLICSFTQIAQIKWVTVSDSLRSLKTNEQLWVNCSGLGIRSFAHRSFAHFAQIKWVTVSASLRSLKTNERLWANGSGHPRQMSDLPKKFWLKNLNSYFLVCFINFIYIFLFKKWVIRSLPLFWWPMWANRSGYPPKMSDVSKSLRLLTRNEQPWGIRSGRSQKMSDNEGITQSLKKIEQMSKSFVFLRKLLIPSFFHKKRVIHSENWWVNSQPWNRSGRSC